MTASEVLERFEAGEEMRAVADEMGIGVDDVLVIVARERSAKSRRLSDLERAPRERLFVEEKTVPWTPVDPRRPVPVQERSLRAAVLTQAIHDARHGDADALRWIRGAQSSERGWSCAEVCEALDVDPDAVVRVVWQAIGRSMRWSSMTAAGRRRT